MGLSDEAILYRIAVERQVNATPTRLFKVNISDIYIPMRKFQPLYQNIDSNLENKMKVVGRHIRRRYCILHHVISSCDLVFYLYPCVLCQKPVFIRQFLRVPFLMVQFLSPLFFYFFQSCPILSYSLRWFRTLLCHPVRPSGVVDWS